MTTSPTLTPGRNPFRRGVDAFGMGGGRASERIAPFRTVSELFEKRWMEGAVPLILALTLCLVVIGTTDIGAANIPLILDDVAEWGLLAVGLTVVLVAGGIDLSIGSIVGLVAISALVADRVWLWPPGLVLPAAVLFGALLGSINGYLIAVVRMRPFITTLVTLITFGGAAVALQNANTARIGVARPALVWDAIPYGEIIGIPTAWFTFLAVLVVAHSFLTRSRWGWWVTATGSDRRSARRNGIPVTAVTFWAYVASGALAGSAAILTTARLGRTDSSIGNGWELIALTAVVLGGVSLQGGRGSVLRAAVGVVVVAVIRQATITAGLDNDHYTVILAAALLAFTLLDLQWGKYRRRAVEKLKIDPARVELGPLIDVTEPGTVWTPDRDLTDAPPVGLGRIRGAEACAVDADGNVYAGDQRGWVWRFRGIEDTEGEVFSRTGGFPCGHAWDRDGKLLVAVGGMGIYRIGDDGEPEMLANKVTRSPFSLIDDSGLRAVDDLDVTPDGSVYASDFSTRNNSTDFLLELVEFRPNGRLVKVHPDGRTEIVASNMVFPNGVCTAHDGESILVSSTGLCRVDRLWVSGPKEGAARTGAGEPARLPGQHPPRLRRQLLDAAGGSAHPDVGSAEPLPGRPPPDDPRGLGGRLGGPAAQRLLHRQVQRRRRDRRRQVGRDPGELPDGHRRHRARRLSLLRRRLEQPHRPPRARPERGRPHRHRRRARHRRGTPIRGGTPMTAFRSLLKEFVNPDWAAHPSVPPMEAGLRPNLRLDEAREITEPGVHTPGALVATAAGTVAFADGRTVIGVRDAGTAVLARLDGPVTALAADGETLIAAVAGSGLVDVSPTGEVSGRCTDRSVAECVTDLAVLPDGTVLATVGSTVVGPDEWTRALVAGDRSGRIVRVDGTAAHVAADGLAWPSGIAPAADGHVIVALSLDHRLELRAVDALDAAGQPVSANLPVYPGRISGDAEGHWVAAPYPRNRITELLLDEPEILADMRETVPAENWFVPRLRPGDLFGEAMQMGQLRVHGVVKSWAPPRSGGVVFRLDRAGRIVESAHARVDSDRHGATGVVAIGDRLIVALAGHGSLLELEEN
ncbi:MAG: SMP-30/gluconolactonase/LRE family protein [Gordonia sp. (in: high G+C Gram-positive bacteria)]|uniref:ABC transporter permease subunit n=1 Tax=Gordonia sp. (in: high G+C Gram-positive bacteria) TaxID=84139 RepID=UPI0039E494D4